MKNATLTQVPLPKSFHTLAKNHPHARRNTITELYGEWIQAFLEFRRRLPLTPQFIKYYASPNNSIPTSIWINDTLLKEVKAISSLDQIAINRVIYTAIVHQMKQNGGLDSVW